MDAKPVRLSLCMIVRDSSRTLEACLTGIRPWVDEMIVVDTGSTDETPDLARSLGARVCFFPWCDSFARARNESLNASGDWLFWMDSDDTIDAENGRKLRELADRPLESSPMAYVMQVHCPGPGNDGTPDMTVVDHVKMFRNLPDLRFEGRIHEQVLPAIRRLEGEVAWSDVYVVHSGSDQSPEGRKRKQERDLRLLELELEDHPNHTFALFNLGMTYADMQRYGEAADALRRSLAAALLGESHLRKVYALLVSSLTQLGDFQAAEASCQAGLALFPEDAELWFRRGMLEHQQGRLPDAVTAYRHSLRTTEERHFSSMDPGIRGFKARHNLAIVYGEMGRHDLAELQWRQAVEEVPSYRAAWRGLGDALLRQRRHVTAEVVAEQMAADRWLRCESYMLLAQIAQAREDFVKARAELDVAAQENEGDVELLRLRCQFLFEHGEPDEAAAELGRLVELEPTDGSAHHNLATVYMRQSRFDEAIKSFRVSLAVRPGAAATYRQLGYALQYAGRSAEAASAWLDADGLSAAPHDARAIAFSYRRNWVVDVSLGGDRIWHSASNPRVVKKISKLFARKIPTAVGTLRH